MGILAEPLQFIRDLRAQYLPRGFSVAELGDQWITCESPHRLAEDFYREIGSKRYCSIDGNGRATVIHDLNKPWRGVERYDLVTDFGTGEHIFSQWQVWRTLHVLCKVGGFIVFDRPASGYPEHGYYNANRCLFDDIAAANHYEVFRLEQAETVRGTLWRGVWRKVTERDFITPQQGRYRKLLRPITEA